VYLLGDKVNLSIACELGRNLEEVLEEVSAYILEKDKLKNRDK
jgi:hypothetical protein